MPSQPFLKELSLENFRGLANLRLAPLRRITAIGGLNGAGKTTVLDSIFQFMDCLGPFPILRSAQFRQTPTTLEDMHRINESSERRSAHRFNTRIGDFVAEWTWEPQDLSGTVGLAVGPSHSPESKTAGNQLGYTLSVRRGQTEVIRRHMADSAGSIVFKEAIAPLVSFPPASYLSRTTIMNPMDLANKYSRVVQLRLKSKLLENMRIIAPNLQDLEVLHVANQPVLFATIDSQLVPLSFAGDGATTVASILLAIITSPGGVVCIDEFDASIHYSTLKEVWSLIHDACVEHDVQIFAATHSRESAVALFSAVDRNSGNDVIFYRLDRVNGSSVATPYTWQDMQEVDAEDWEIR